MSWPDAVDVLWAMWPDPVTPWMLDRHRRALAELGPAAAARDLVAEAVGYRWALAEGWQSMKPAERWQSMRAGNR